ncbi:MAG: hypothetical protein EBR59_03025 [Methylococcaceae bacterium]|jgi:hypothetical protein|nr:hypothetical protein [Methylococcaceae bacterium]
MNTLIYYAFNILILSVVLLLVGLVKPKWILFWVKNPTRLPIIMLSSVLFMTAAVMFGEGNKQLKQEKAQTSVSQPAAPSSEVPVVAPVTSVPAATPATAPTH